MENDIQVSHCKTFYIGSYLTKYFGLHNRYTTMLNANKEEYQTITLCLNVSFIINVL